MKKKKPEQHPETLAIHAGREPDPASGALSPAIHPSSTFLTREDGGGYVYGRYGNPNRNAVETALAELEGGLGAACFASGVAAAMAVFQSLTPGDRVLVSADAYHGIRTQLRQRLIPWGLDVVFVDTSDPAAISRAITPGTRLVWVETPSNPLLKISDLAALAELARGAGATTVCDNTFSTSLLQRPFEQGFDLVMYSSTKYLGGHSDLIGGAVIVRDDSGWLERLHQAQKLAGAVPAPFDCWLLLRSLATLPMRVRAQNANAAALAEWLQNHPAVERVYYPGLPEHPGHETARRQMRGFGGMLSITLKDGPDFARALPHRTRLFRPATSLGGLESLIEHRASIEGPDSTTPAHLVRLSAGGEHIEDLIADLQRALEA